MQERFQVSTVLEYGPEQSFVLLGGILWVHVVGKPMEVSVKLKRLQLMSPDGQISMDPMDVLRGYA
jgi:hypothetical protein